MSTSQPEDPGPTVDTAASAAFPTAEPLDAECPHCGTRLRNVSAGADGRVHCLNCGQRFRLTGEVAGLVMTGEAQRTDQKERTKESVAREPSAPTYGYLRIAGVAMLIIGTGLATFFGWAAYMQFGRASFTLAPEMLAWTLALSLGPLLVGLWGWQCSALPARMDVALTGLAWHRDRMPGPLPTPPGSSLPHVLPAAAAGGLAGFSIVFASAEGSGEVDVLALGIGAAVIGIGLLTGFAIENLRLVLWRQALLAERLAGKATVFHRPVLMANLPWGMSSLCAVGAAGGLVIALLGIWTEARLRNQEALIMFVSILLVAGFGWTVTLLARGLEHVSLVWRQAAWRKQPPWNPRPGRGERLVRSGIFFPFVWIVVGGCLMICLMCSWRRIDGDDFLIMLGFSTFFAFLAVLLSRVLANLHAIRRAQELVFEQPDLGQWGFGPRGVFVAHVAWAAIQLLVGLFVTYAIVQQQMRFWATWRTSSIFWEVGCGLFGLLTAVLGFSYFAFWLALIYRELMRLRGIGAHARVAASREAAPADASGA